MGICSEKCRDCYYYLAVVGCCDYLGKAGKQRDCPAGDECSKKIIRPQGAPLVDDRLVWELYEKQRLSDKEIEALLGLTNQKVFFWRKSFGYPPNVRGSAKVNREPTEPPEVIMRRWANGNIEN